jgi:asparagine N-glycosylation enzyme membrane subunit Stt3
MSLLRTSTLLLRNSQPTAVVLNASGIIQTTFLFSRGRNLEVVGTAAIQSTALFVASLIFVRWLGVLGFGVATLVALADLIYTDRRVRRIAPFSYRRMLPFAVMLVPLVLFPVVPVAWSALLVVPLLAGAALPVVRSESRRLRSLVRSSFRGSSN